MAIPADHPPISPRRKFAVRLLFLACILYFITGLTLRKIIGEPYPGLFMPGFPGIGLQTMSATEGETFLPRITLTFTDQTTVEVTAIQLSKAGLYPPTLVQKLFIPQEVARNTSTPTFNERLHQLATDLFKPTNESPITTAPVIYKPIETETTDYLETKVRTLFPDKNPQSLKIQIFREAVRLDHPQSRRIIGLLAQRVVLFSHENHPGKD